LILKEKLKLEFEQEQLEKQLMEHQKLQQIQIEQLQKQIDEFVEAAAAASTSSVTKTTSREPVVESSVLNENDLNHVLNNLSETLVKTKQLNTTDNIE